LTAIVLPKDEIGLPRESVGLCHQIATLDRSKLTERIGALSADALARIEAGIKAATGLI
jgi:mRNA-degrading endonuclease toxin of MazEF toxin-antitoxin module